MNIVVCGGCSFLGKSFIKLALENGHTIYNIDKITYAADEDYCYTNFLYDEKYNGKYMFDRGDINDVDKLPPCDIVVNYAASSHVDNSIGDNEDFIKTNVLGVRNLLEVIRKLPKYDRPLFLQISTDEVVGDNVDGWIDENVPLNPSSPYSSSKAAAELLIKSWARTYGIEYLIVRPCNNYGERQHPEKLIPKTIMRFRQGKPAVIHGTGGYKRSWIHMADTARAVLHLIDRKYKNEIFNVTTQYELTNLEVIGKIFGFISDIDKLSDWIAFVDNRAGQDQRYGSSNTKLLSTGFKFEHDFDTEIKKIVMADEPIWGVSFRKV